MRAAEFWKTVTEDESNFRESLISLLEDNGIRYCVIGGVGVNAYVEPVVTLDLDLVVAVEQLGGLEDLLRTRFRVEQFPHSLNLSARGSKLRVQIQTDPRYFGFVERAQRREVLDVLLPVAAIEDLLEGKVWAALDPERRASKRQKDLADISRILESYPHLRDRVPAPLLDQLL